MGFRKNKKIWPSKSMLIMNSNTTGKNKLSTWSKMTKTKITKMPWIANPTPLPFSSTSILKSMPPIQSHSQKTKSRTSSLYQLTSRSSSSLEELKARAKYLPSPSTKRPPHLSNRPQNKKKQKSKSSETKISCSTFSTMIWYQSTKCYRRSRKKNSVKNSKFLL